MPFFGREELSVIVGLGNPGREHFGTRHNVGYRVVDLLAERHGVKLWRRRFEAACGKGKVRGCAAWLVKPQTYMNLSGCTVERAVRELRLELDDLLVVSDDMALPAGTLRLREKGSDGGHKGLASVIESLGTQDFARLRVGIGEPVGDPADYVLAPFSPEERAAMAAAEARAADAAEAWLRDGVTRAMAAFNG
jgi:PTH1 family peptidyl-tRNA hydrolase